LPLFKNGKIYIGIKEGGIMGEFKKMDIENRNREKEEYLKEKLEQEHWEDLEQDRLKKLKELVKDNE